MTQRCANAAGRSADSAAWATETLHDEIRVALMDRDLLERSYISRIKLYGGEKIAYVGESLDGDLATVRTKIATKQGTEVPVDYRMLQRGERWLVFDVSIEGVSLISNYRTQFARIIQSSSYQALVKKMKTKQEEFRLEEESRPAADKQ